MKRLSFLILTAAMLLVFSACGKKQAPGVTYPTEPPAPCSVGQTELSQEQAGLMGLSEDYTYTVSYSFHTEAPADGIKLVLFRLENGAWEDVAGGSWSELQGPQWNVPGPAEGKLLVQFNNLWEDFPTAVQAGTSQIGMHLHPQGSVEGNASVAFLTAVTDFQWEQTLPLAVQVVSHQDRVLAPDLDIWNHPEAYSNQGYEEVYLLAMALRRAPETP